MPVIRTKMQNILQTVETFRMFFVKKTPGQSKAENNYKSNPTATIKLNVAFLTIWEKIL